MAYGIRNKLGSRKRKVYVSVNEYQHAGLRLLGVRSGKCPADVAYGLITAELARMARKDEGFNAEWNRECARILKEEIEK